MRRLLQQVLTAPTLRSLIPSSNLCRNAYRGYCLEMICADFLAGANLDSGQPDVLLHAISSLFKFLPGEQKQAFPELVTQQIQ